MPDPDGQGWHAARLHLHRRGLVTDLDVDDVLAQWRGWQEAQGLARRTIDERASLVRRYLVASGEQPLGITARGIVRYLGREGLKPRSRWVYRAHLAAFSTFLVRSHLRADDPLVDVPVVRKPAGEPRPITNDELGDLLAKVSGPARMMVLLAAYAGLRVHEIAKVRGRDLDRRAGTLRVEGKGEKVALLPVHEAIVAEAVGYPDRDYWFPARDGGPISRQQVSTEIRRGLRAARIEATAHQLRHWYGTALLRAGVDLRVVSDLMRHASLQTTQGYTRPSDVQRSSAIDRLTLPGEASS